MLEPDGNTEVYCIIGNPVAHSLSPLMHNAAFVATGANRVYVPFLVEDIADAVKGLRALNIKGASVTIPHKESILPLLDDIDPVALKIGAVNTVHVVGDGRKRLLVGSNSDWLGSNRALADHTELRGATVIVLGAGGSARAIAFGLLEAGAEVVLCSRTERRGRELAADLGCRWYPLADLEKLPGSVLVHATSVGMAPNAGDSLVAQRHLERFAVVMDIVYAPIETRLLREAKEAGCRVVNGLEMLLYQGVAQYELWTGQAAPVEVMRARLQQAVDSRGR
ncbi:MAG: shikimate dehydrogenase [Desulfobulbaceae bacterium]|nr:MAG: shikimate dehydrogenase [Desulfobulbaceae bacterium]